MSAAASEIGIACVQMTPARGAVADNLAVSVDAIQRAADSGHELVVLPELATSGYAFNNRAEARETSEVLPDGLVLSAWREAARRLGVWIVGGLLERDGNELYDTSVLIDRDGSLLASYRKVHLWSTEHLWFELGRAPSRVVTLPFGRVAMAICFDLWVPELFRHYARQGADLVCVPSNWSSPTVVKGGDRPIVDHLAIATAHVNSLYIAGADRGGSDGDFTFLGASMIVNPRGEMVARAAIPGRLEEIVSGRVDLMEARVRKTWSRFNRALDVEPRLFSSTRAGSPNGTLTDKHPTHTREGGAS